MAIILTVGGYNSTMTTQQTSLEKAKAYLAERNMSCIKLGNTFKYVPSEHGSRILAEWLKLKGKR